MKKKKYHIWFWQQMFSPHVAELAISLADIGYKVFFVASYKLSKMRLSQGWREPKSKKVKFILAPNKAKFERLALKASNDSIHFCEGLHNNGLIYYAQKIILKRRLRHWVLIESIEDSYFFNRIFKRVFYRLIFLRWRKYLSGLLAIGENASSWFIARGMFNKTVYPFAYFLKPPKDYLISNNFKSKKKNNLIKFIFVGRLIKLKNIDLLIKGIAAIGSKKVELWIVGNGPEKKNLHILTDTLLPSQVKWLGKKSNLEVPEIISKCDCLILPSHYDGWGAVISEALMVGTPVICSDKCGASEIVKFSRVGGIFPSNNLNALTNILKKQYKIGKLSKKKRQAIIKWSKCLNSISGAKYLDLLINNINNKYIIPPWKK